MNKFGIPDKTWSEAKAEGKRIISSRARGGRTISYSDLAAELSTLTLDAHDVCLAHLLGDISTEENAARRGMLSVLVVHKSGDMRPGEGFFDLARQLGRDVSDENSCWVKELEFVFGIWKTRK